MTTNEQRGGIDIIMEDIWKLLGIAPGSDVTAIKKAYAQQARKYHPEENPEMFLQLRKAYQAALNYNDSPKQQKEAPEPEIPHNEAAPESRVEDTGWHIAVVEQEQESEQNPYMEHSARKRFLDLYTGSQRKNPKLWMDYFTSPEFLEVYREPAFTALLLEDVERQEQVCPPNREFLTWLHIAYLFSSREVEDPSLPGSRGRQFQLFEGAGFDGIEAIFRIAIKGPVPKQPKGNELAMFISFSEYRRLMELAESGVWDEQAVADARYIIDRYVLSYLKEKCERREWNDVERHPAGVRLLNAFFARQSLPEELYRILWERLSLKTAQMGRTKIFYGRLREIVVGRLPGIDEEAEERFGHLYQEAPLFDNRSRQCGETDLREDVEAVDAFFAREDVQRALRNRRFVEEQLLCTWLNNKTCNSFLWHVIVFYSENADAPYAERAISQAQYLLRMKEVKRQLEEDRMAEAMPDFTTSAVKFTYRPFFRHWLNTGFYLAENPETGQPIWDYLNKYFSYAPDWSYRFLRTEDGEIMPRSITVTLDSLTIEVIFHMRYIEYKADEGLVYRPIFHWDTLMDASGENDALLFLLLPITAASYDRYDAVREELARRLENTAAPEEERPAIAAILADSVCRLPLEAHPLELFAENEEKLYGCSWFPREGVLLFFEQTVMGRQELPEGCYQGIYKEAEAISLARRLLDDISSPAKFHLSLLQRLPSMVCVQPRSAQEKTLEDEAVNREELEALIRQFAQGDLLRLQFCWMGGSMVFRSDGNCFACFYFEDNRDAYYTLLSLPEMYRTMESDDVQYLPFGLGKLPEYAIHHDTKSILRRLDRIFMQIGQGQSPDVMVDGKLFWSVTVHLNNGSHRYRIAKQKLGGFPEEEERNYILARFVLSRYPEKIGMETCEGIRRMCPIDNRSRSMVTMALVEFMQNKLQRLCLSWGPQTEGQPWYPFHIVLLQDNGRYMMAYLRDDIQRAEYYVADVRSYMSVEGKKYPKDTFLGSTVPAYLVHQDAKRIRNCLDLIFDDLGDLPAITGQFARFAPESPVKPRSYEEIRKGLVADFENIEQPPNP